MRASELPHLLRNVTNQTLQHRSLMGREELNLLTQRHSPEVLLPEHGPWPFMAWSCQPLTASRPLRHASATPDSHFRPTQSAPFAALVPQHKVLFSLLGVTSCPSFKSSVRGHFFQARKLPQAPSFGTLALPCAHTPGSPPLQSEHPVLTLWSCQARSSGRAAGSVGGGRTVCHLSGSPVGASGPSSRQSTCKTHLCLPVSRTGPGAESGSLNGQWEGGRS